MNLPRFVAEASLFNAGGRYFAVSGLYQSGGYKIDLPPATTNTITAAMKAEDIEVFGCRPGFLQLGEGPSMVCINPSDPFGTGGHDGGGTGPGGDGPGGGNGGGGTDTPPPRKCRPARGRVEIQGVLWRQQCPSDQLRSCCQKKDSQCRKDCGSSGSQASIQCKNECGGSYKVCVDERNPRGPEVCSLP